MKVTVCADNDGAVLNGEGVGAERVEVGRQRYKYKITARFDDIGTISTKQSYEVTISAEPGTSIVRNGLVVNQRTSHSDYMNCSAKQYHHDWITFESMTMGADNGVTDVIHADTHLSL